MQAQICLIIVLYQLCAMPRTAETLVLGPVGLHLNDLPGWLLATKYLATGFSGVALSALELRWQI